MGNYIGLDLGGTNIKSCVIDDHGKVLAEQSITTDAEKGANVVIERLVESARRVAQAAGLEMAEVDGIGVGSPGPIDFEGGIIISAPNIKGFVNVPLRDRIGDATGRPTWLENDANAAAFGEFMFGAGKDPDIRHLAMFTLGTGVGGGLIVDGKVIHGAHGLGAEIGHSIVVPNGDLCGCGQHGCLERYCSASACARWAVDAIESGRQTTLRKVFEANNNHLEAKDVFDAARQGDNVAESVVDEVCRHLAIACINICRILDPQMIVFAGGMIHAGSMLFDRVRKYYDQHTWTAAPNPVEITSATLGNQAGRIGAAAVALDGLKQ